MIHWIHQSVNKPTNKSTNKYTYKQVLQCVCVRNENRMNNKLGRLSYRFEEGVLLVDIDLGVVFNVLVLSPFTEPDPRSLPGDAGGCTVEQLVAFSHCQNSPYVVMYCCVSTKPSPSVTSVYPITYCVDIVTTSAV